MKRWFLAALLGCWWHLPVQAECRSFSYRPLVQNPYISDYKFTKEADGALETFTMSNRTAVTVRQHGCQTYALTYQFDTAGIKDPADVIYWYQKSLALLEEALRLSQPSLNLRQGMLAVRGYLGDRHKQPKMYGLFLAYGKQETVVIESVESLEHRRFRLKITFTSAP